MKNTSMMRRRFFAGILAATTAVSTFAVSPMTYADEVYPESLRKINDPPVLLYYRGHLPDFRNEFSADESTAFVIHLDSDYETSNDEITTLFVIRNEDGHVVSCKTSTETWTRMWYRHYCEMDIPEIPGTPGQYTMSVYFNGKFVKTVEFTIDQ